MKRLKFYGLVFCLCLFSVTSFAQVMSFYQQPVAVPAGLTFQTPAGENVRLEDFKGEVVLLNLWATWCTPCAIEMPAFNFLQKRYGSGGFRVLPIAIQDSPTAVSMFMEKHKLDYLTPYMDDDEQIGRAFRPKSTPTTYLINRQGEVIAGKEGLSEWLSEEMMTLIETELKKGQKPYELPADTQIIDKSGELSGGVRF